MTKMHSACRGEIVLGALIVPTDFSVAPRYDFLNDILSLTGPPRRPRRCCDQVASVRADTSGLSVPTSVERYRFRSMRFLTNGRDASVFR